jgi:RNA polymerase sigma-70 factor (ECF subfamily)
VLDQLSAENSRASVRFTVPGDGQHSDGPPRPPGPPGPPGSSPAVPVDELAARRQFEAMVAEHRPALLARAYELCRSHFNAEDIVQDALMRAMRTTAPLKDVTRARTWLLQIVTTTFIDGVRVQRRRPLHVEVDDRVPAQAPDPPSPWDHITQDDVRAAVDSLPDDVRDTYRMYALEGLDHTAISAAQRVKRATVGTRIHRARKRLRALLLGERTRQRGEGRP